jgi:hypothetical protein
MIVQTHIHWKKMEFAKYNINYTCLERENSCYNSDSKTGETVVSGPSEGVRVACAVHTLLI